MKMGKDLVVRMRDAFLTDNPGRDITFLDATCVGLHHVMEIKGSPEEKKKVKEAITPSWLWACALDGDCKRFELDGFSICDDDRLGDESRSAYGYCTQEMISLLFENCKGDCCCPPCWLIDLDRRFVWLQLKKHYSRPDDLAEKDWRKLHQKEIDAIVEEGRKQGRFPHVPEELIRKKAEQFISQGKVDLVEHFLEILGEAVREDDYLKMVSALLDSGNLRSAVNLAKEKNLLLSSEVMEKLFLAWIKQEGIRTE